VLPSDKGAFFNSRAKSARSNRRHHTVESPLLLGYGSCAGAGRRETLRSGNFRTFFRLALLRQAFEKRASRRRVNIVTWVSERIGEPLIYPSRCGKVAFTGGDRTGRPYTNRPRAESSASRWSLAGSPRTSCSMTPTGSGVNGVVAGIFAATGQTCIAGSAP